MFPIFACLLRETAQPHRKVYCVFIFRYAAKRTARRKRPRQGTTNITLPIRYCFPNKIVNIHPSSCGRHRRQEDKYSSIYWIINNRYCCLLQTALCVGDAPVMSPSWRTPPTQKAAERHAQFAVFLFCFVCLRFVISFCVSARMQDRGAQVRQIRRCSRLSYCCRLFHSL